MRPKALLQMLKDTIHEWSEDKAQTLGAALAYYSVFSIAPLVILAISIAGLVFGEQAARGAIEDEIKETVGEPVARAIQDLLRHTSDPGAGWLGTWPGGRSGRCPGQPPGFQGWKSSAGVPPSAGEAGVALTGGRVAGGHPHLGLLLLADPPVRRRVHPCLRPAGRQASAA